MVAPGDNLEFEESEYFARRVEPVRQIADAVMAYLKEWPNLGKDSVGGMREIGVEFEGTNYLVLFRRNRNKIVLFKLFEMPRDEKMLKAALEDLKRLSKEKR